MAKKIRGKTNKTNKTKTTKQRFVDAWNKASVEDRREFIDKVGLDAMLDALTEEKRGKLFALVEIEIEKERERTRPATVPGNGGDEESPI